MKSETLSSTILNPFRGCASSCCIACDVVSGVAGLVAGVEVLVAVLVVPELLLCRCVQPKKIGLPFGDTPQVNGRKGKP